MADWYDEGMERLYHDLVSDTGLALEQVIEVYGTLYGYGLIDYDNEKEVIWDRYEGEDG